MAAPESLALGRDSKSELQEFLSSNGYAPPEYRLIEESGPPHDRQFRFQILVDDTIVGVGQGKSKKIAQQAAAAKALDTLQPVMKPAWVKPVTVPFFISHQGCPHTCVFCDQRTISGANGTLPTAEQIRARIDLWRSTAGDRPLEVAFFGGTFTALPEEIQAELLAPLQPLLETGTLDSVRISTRPDCIDADHVGVALGHGGSYD